MTELLKAALGAPIASILVVAGIAFLAIAIIGTHEKARRGIAGIVGVILLAAGIFGHGVGQMESCGLEPEKPAWETVAEPATQPSADFNKNNHYIQPPQGAGDGGHLIRFELVAPGTMTDVQEITHDGGGCGYTHACPDGGKCGNFAGTNLSIPRYRSSGGTGELFYWSNSGDGCVFKFRLHYTHPVSRCVRNCDYERLHRIWEEARSTPFRACWWAQLLRWTPW